jgi:uncharacterized protein
LTIIFVDADACPVKTEINRVAKRYELSVKLVANVPMNVPEASWIEFILVKHGADAADDWIAENVSENDIVTTADIPLAARCLEKKSAVIDFRGKAFTEDGIGAALASRELMNQLRGDGLVTGGPAPFGKQDRSQFLQRLDQTIQSLRRKR